MNGLSIDNIDEMYEINKYDLLVDDKLRPCKSVTRDAEASVKRFSEYYLRVNRVEFNDNDVMTICSSDRINDTTNTNVRVMREFGFVQVISEGKYKFTELFIEYTKKNNNPGAFILEMMYKIKSKEDLTMYSNLILCTLREGSKYGRIISFPDSEEKFVSKVSSLEQRYEYRKRVYDIYGFSGRNKTPEDDEYTPNANYRVLTELKNLNLIKSSEKENGLDTFELTPNGVHLLQTIDKNLSVENIDNKRDEQSTDEIEEVLNHNLWGIHIKKENDALSNENPHICIGWSNLGDLAKYDTIEDISIMYDQLYPDRNNYAKGQEMGMIRRFLKELQIGDYVIFAESSEFHIGRIESDYIYDETDYPNQSDDYKNVRKVTWLKKHINRKDISKSMHNSLATAMSIFGINDYRSAVVDLLRGTYKKDDDIVEGETEDIELVYRTNVSIPYERNRIVFGAPGTGKSFKLKDDCERMVQQYDAEFVRVTFHPEYSYSQFVGTYKPVMDDDGDKIKYQYVPGPFMRILAEALKNALVHNPKPYILIIEEINRAKVAAVFGEVFQLLDRDDDGISEYEIQASEDIRRFLADEIGGTPENFAKIRIPNNMFIWATMNSADQGVFPMDTAFKRRWNFEYLGINENEEKIQGKGNIHLPGSDEPIEWNMLRKAINDKMSSADFKINEDKLMGPFFLSKKVIASDEEGMIVNPDKFILDFKSKVIMYLYEDAVKQGKHRFFDGCDNSKYSSVCDAFNAIGLSIFGPTFKETYYDKQRDDK